MTSARWQAPARPHNGQWLTTADVARILEVTPWSVRWLARTEQLAAAETTRSGVRLFRQSEVERLVKRRADARLARVSAFRPKMLRVRGEPHQLSLFARPLALFHGAAPSSTDAWVDRPRSFRQSA